MHSRNLGDFWIEVNADPAAYVPSMGWCYRFNNYNNDFVLKFLKIKFYHYTEIC